MPGTAGKFSFVKSRTIGGWRPRIGVSPALHNLPLVYGLGGAGAVQLYRDRPERLGNLLLEKKIDVALLDVADLQRRDLQPLILPVGGVSADGPTRTACIYARMSPTTIRQIHAGPEAATPAMIAQVLWAEAFERRLQVLDRPARLPNRITERPQAILLTGDEVNTPPGNDYKWRVDIGQAWSSLTNLPLVFSVWAMQPDAKVSPTLQARRARATAEMLEKTRQLGMADIECLIGDYAVRFGWDIETARTYLTRQIQYKFTQRHRRGLEMLFHLARKHGYIQKIRPLTFAV